MEKRNPSNLLFVFLIYLGWILIDEFVPYLNRIFDFRKINLWLLPSVRMTLMFLVTYFYVKFYEKQSFSSGFNFSFKKIGKNILWAFVFFIIVGAFAMPYQFLIVKPLTGEMKTASSVVSHNVVNPFVERLIEYL
jgi:hypothetical protein